MWSGSHRVSSMFSVVCVSFVLAGFRCIGLAASVHARCMMKSLLSGHATVRPVLDAVYSVMDI